MRRWSARHHGLGLSITRPSWRPPEARFTPRTANPAGACFLIELPVRSAPRRSASPTYKSDRNHIPASTRRLRCRQQSSTKEPWSSSPQAAEPTMRLHVLVVDSDPALRSACAEIAASLGYVVEALATWARRAACCAAARPTSCCSICPRAPITDRNRHRGQCASSAQRGHRDDARRIRQCGRSMPCAAAPQTT